MHRIPIVVDDRESTVVVVALRDILELLLKPVPSVASASLIELAGCLKYQGPAKSLDEMEHTIEVRASQVREGSDDPH